MDEPIWNIELLRERALDQYGYVTTSQALQDGVAKATLSKLAKRNRLKRVGHGVYRVPQVPNSQYDQLMLAVLWTGVPEAALSHETALDVYDVCDINPRVIHVTVGKKRRIARSGGEAYQIHNQDIDSEQLGWWKNIPIVKPQTALLQCINYGTPSYLLRQAIDQSSRFGLISVQEKQDLLIRLDNRDIRQS